MRVSLNRLIPLNTWNFAASSYNIHIQFAGSERTRTYAALHKQKIFTKNQGNVVETQMRMSVRF